VHIPDLINGIYESLGGAFIALSVIKLHREKVVRGVSWLHVAFFSSWGIWNLYFYPHLDQWFSFYGGVVLVATNLVWLAQIVWYNWIWEGSQYDAFLHENQIDKYEEAKARPVMKADQFGGFDRKTPVYSHMDK